MACIRNQKTCVPTHEAVDLLALLVVVYQNGYNRPSFLPPELPTPMRPTSIPSTLRYRGGVSARIGKGFVQA